MGHEEISENTTPVSAPLSTPKYGGWGVSAVFFIAMLVLGYKLNAANDQAAALQAKLTTTQEMVTSAGTLLLDTKNELAATKRELAKANLPEVGVSLYFATAGWFNSESGLIAHITNNEGESASFTITVERPSENNTKTVTDFAINSGATREIGENQGWAFVSGDTITISQIDHKSSTWTVR